VVELIDDRATRLGFGLTDSGPIAVRVLGRGEREPVDVLVRKRIARADALRGSLVEAGTDAYRIVAGAGDGLDGLVVDRYGDLAVLRVYASAWEPHLDAVVAALAGLSWCRAVLRRFGVERVDGRAGAEVVHGEDPGETRVVTEHGMRMLVRPRVGQKTGLFLDQREHRRLIRTWSRGRTVVNLFAYTGGFSVAAALGGAARTITVDLAPDAVEDARENFRLNGLDPDRHGFEVADAFAWSPARPLGLVILDPPSLARDRAAKDAAVRAYGKLHRHHAAAVAEDGLLATSSCTARLPMAEWRASVAEALAKSGEWSWHWCSAEPPDHPVALGHPEGAYLKFALLARRGPA
jgi:23S rRNA (cytosine1962-C5)-methyltransferase